MILAKFWGLTQILGFLLSRAPTKDLVTRMTICFDVGLSKYKVTWLTQPQSSMTRKFAVSISHCLVLEQIAVAEKLFLHFLLKGTNFSLQ